MAIVAVVKYISGANELEFKWKKVAGQTVLVTEAINEGCLLINQCHCIYLKLYYEWGLNTKWRRSQHKHSHNNKYIQQTLRKKNPVGI